MTTLDLPYPELAKGRFVSLDAYTDEALFAQTRVRIAFTTRQGGVSEGPYAALNLGSHVGDDLAAVKRNRALLLEAFTRNDAPLLVPNQVHGDTVLSIDSVEEAEALQQKAQEGVDALVVGVPQVASLLCYADCVPVIIVSPTRRFAVVHAGWRGVMNRISVKSVHLMAQQDVPILGEGAQRTYNVYIGPHIRKECFETSEDLYQRFIDEFGSGCDAGYRHIDLSNALRTQLEEMGVQPARICDLRACTVCGNEEFFSYRAQGGTAGRHGAFAVAQ